MKTSIDQEGFVIAGERVLCDVCGQPFTEEQWEERHNASTRDLNWHDECCPQCALRNADPSICVYEDLVCEEDTEEPILCTICHQPFTWEEWPTRVNGAHEHCPGGN